MSDFDIHDPDGAGELPCAVGLLASTLMLMTGVAVPEPDARVDAQALRGTRARRIVSNLFFLQHHPALPPGLRQVAAHLQTQWLSAGQPTPHERPAHTGADAPMLH